MKLFRHGPINKEKAGVIIDDAYHDASSFGEDFNEHFFETDGLERFSDYLHTHPHDLPKIAAGSRIGSPVARPSKIVCIGLNYADHAKETGATPPAEPVIFIKSTTSLVGPNDDIII